MIKVPKVACINDISGLGRCSLTIAIPVLSVLGVQCCPVPTAVLSCHTGFENFYFKDMTESMPEYLNDWKDKNIQFDAVYTGFLGSLSQIKTTEDFIKSQKSSLVVVDTVMGDNGSIYPTYTKKMCDEMQRLVTIADIITPNVTEACYLTSTDYKGEDISIFEAKEIIKKLQIKGCKSCIITGIESNDKLVNLVLENSQINEISINKTKSHSGTGDLFASIVTGFLVKGKTLTQATDIASKFIYDVLEFTYNNSPPSMDGVLFEPLLYKLGADNYGK